MLEDYDDAIVALTRRCLAPNVAADAAPLLSWIDALSRLFDTQAGAPQACVGPVLPGATLVGGARVPGTSLELDPAQAAWCIAWLSGDAVFGALLPLGDWLARRAVLTGVRPARVTALLQADAETRSLAASLGGTPLAQRLAIAAMAARLLGASDEEVAAAVSIALADGVPMHADGSPIAAAALASSGVRAALLARAGVPGLRDARSGLTLQPVTHVSRVDDALLVWHRFDDAVRRRFPVRAADRLRASIHADAALEALPLQSFVATLVRAS